MTDGFVFPARLKDSRATFLTTVVNLFIRSTFLNSFVLDQFYFSNDQNEKLFRYNYG